MQEVVLGLIPLRALERLFHSRLHLHPVALLYPSSCFSPSVLSSLVLHNIPVRISSCFASKRNCDSFREKPCSNISSSCWWPIHDLIWETHRFAGFSVPVWVSAQMGLPCCLVWVPLSLVSSVGVHDGFSYDNGPASVRPVSDHFRLCTDALGYLLHSRKNCPYTLADIHSLLKTFPCGKLKM